MRYLTLVADYDGTLADNDRISQETAAALERLRASGRRAIMVTGRRLNDHLRRGDYSRWFRHSIRDEQLAEEAERIEHRHDLAPSQTRDMVRELIHARYTLAE